MSPPAVIVIGAHRSGTSAVARVLESLGVFMGARVDPNHEALFFLELDEWMLGQCGARWDNPEAISCLIGDDRQAALVTGHLAHVLRSPRSIRFLGWSRWLRGVRIGQDGFGFGFKDPRATFTLPLWLRVFSDAKVVHVHRHGVDVAQSLCKRHVAHLAASEIRYRRNRPLLGFLHKRAGFGDSPRLSTLMGGFELWESYVREARRHVADLGAQALELRYEDLAANPAATVTRLAEFVGASRDGESIRRAAALIQRDRASAHTHDVELTHFARSVERRVSLARGALGEPACEESIRIVAPEPSAERRAFGQGTAP